LGAIDKLLYDQQVALNSGNMDAYYTLQAQIDNGGKPVTAPVAPVAQSPVAQAPVQSMPTQPVAPTVAPTLNSFGQPVTLQSNLYYYDAENNIVGYKPAYYTQQSSGVSAPVVP
jgi:hypothetical protein